jgi:hypothetical protein
MEEVGRAFLKMVPVEIQVVVVGIKKWNNGIF